MSGIVERNTETILAQQAGVIRKAIETSVVTEIDLGEWDKYDDVFNDMALHIFKETDQLQLLGEEFWQQEEPVYDINDTEFITS